MENIVYKTVSFILKNKSEMKHRGGSVYDSSVPLGCNVISVTDESEKPLVFSYNIKEGILSIVDWNKEWNKVRINIE